MQHHHPRGLFQHGSVCSMPDFQMEETILLPKRQPEKLQSKGEFEKKYVVGS